jgi:hypothetical protein
MNVSIPGLIIVCGLQGSGKSFLIRYIMHENQKKFNWGIVFSNTAFTDKGFDYIPREFIHSRYDHSALLNLKTLHERLINEGKEPSAFVIFDDCLYGKQWSDPEFLSLLTQLRHYRITCIISCQYPQSIPPMIRTNAFQVAIFSMTTKRALVALYESYGQLFDSYEQFKKFLLENSANHAFLWYDARNSTTTVDGRYSVLKAPADIPKFKLKFKTKI